MASSDIYSALAALAPTYDSDVTISVRWPDAGSSTDALSNFLDESDGPVRMLGVPDNLDETNTEFEFIALGASARRTYVIQDRLWLIPAEFEQGLQYNSPKMIKYVDSYNSQVLNNRGLTTQSHITDIRYRYGWKTWADGVVWFTVDAIATIEEFC